MFQKPAFGSNTSGFGSFSSATTAASPFGSFKPAAAGSAFGAPPAFGAGAATQPAAQNSLFGASNTNTSLFGASTAAATPAFGANTSGFGFGSAPAAGGGLFSSQPQTGLFGANQNQQSAFGAKPAGFGFGAASTSTPSTGGLFGSPAPAASGLFGQQGNTMSGGGLFSNTTAGGFGATSTATGTAHAKYAPVAGTDVIVKSGSSQSVNIKHHCITCMKEYESKSLEELRLEDYTAGRKGGGAGMFGFQQPAADNKPLFGQTSAFGQPATTTAPSVFGLGSNAPSAFGQTNTFSFGGAAPGAAASGGLFGAPKPAFGATPASTGASLFGTTTTQTSNFGTTNTPSFGFGGNTQNQTSNLFASKPSTSGFPAPGAAPAFGFGSSASAAPSAPLFGAKTPATGFGAPAAGAFGSLSGSFGTSTAPPSGGLFGAGSFGKPATAAPAFGFNAPTTGLGAGVSGGLGGAFAAKPAAPAFGTLGGSSMFPGTNNTFTGGDNSSLFGGSALGGSALGGGLGGGALGSSLGGASAVGNVHDLVLSLVARPYGDSPLLKSSDSAPLPTEPSGPTIPTTESPYRVVAQPSQPARLTRLPLSQDKKSLFDGLEEYDASLDDKLTLKPSRKRLVLRPRADGDANQTQERSIDEPTRDLNGQHSDKENEALDSRREPNREPRDVRDSRDGEKNYLDTSAGKDKFSWLNSPKNQNLNERDQPDGELRANSNDGERRPGRFDSWLGSSRNSPGEKDKHSERDLESTPRLYPNLDRELPIPVDEDRASWIHRRPLPPPPPFPSAERSARDLGLTERTIDSHTQDSAQVSEDEIVLPRDLPPHPCGVKLTRPGYYTIPSLDEMMQYKRPDGSCVVPHLTIGRRNYGNVFYDCEIDVNGLDLDELVHFLNKEVTVYPDDDAKPPVGRGLNRRAVVTLDRIWPRDKTEKRPITDPDRLLSLDYEGKLRRVCDKHDTKFIEYRPRTGSWVFRVEHFSKYSLNDSDEEDDPTPAVLRRQLVNQQLQQAAPIPPQKPAQPPAGLTAQSPGLIAPGLSGPGLSGPGLGGLGSQDTLYAMHHSSLQLLDGAGKAFEMDTTEDHGESQSLYQDSHRAYGVKSPTSELARLEHRSSHHVQLMKASLYADTEMEDDATSISTGDQLVPRGPVHLIAPPSPSEAPPLRAADINGALMDTETEEVQMKPLLVRPHTIVLKYHRKVPPFKNTIAGRLGANLLADLSICRARHSRVGFGPRNALVFPTSYATVHHLPKQAELSELSAYVSGRGEDDWSEPVVARLGLGQGRGEGGDALIDMFCAQLDALLQYSETTKVSETEVGRLVLKPDPSARAAALRAARAAVKDGQTDKFGVSMSYCAEVFDLCEALWADDLDNDGIPGTDVSSIVERHKKLLTWLSKAGAAETDKDLAEAKRGEIEDEEDGHSASVWALMVGGRTLDACKLAREKGDLNMAVLLAQAAGSPTFRSLVARQLSQWRQTGALGLLSGHRTACLRLAGGEAPLEHMALLDWVRALHVTARYLCNQVPSLEQIVRTYEGFLSAENEAMARPSPPYTAEYDVSVQQNGTTTEVVDLRYALIRARALSTPPRLQPAQYTPDSLDYGLCFTISVWLSVIEARWCVGAAAQLAAAGRWGHAILAAAYHPDDVQRGQLIHSLLSRHAPSKAVTRCDSLALSLVRRLGVPEKWLRLAMAHRAQYEHQPALQAEHLVAAEQWNAAHQVLIDELLPEAVLADDLQSISPLLAALQSAAARHEVAGWESGGKALADYGAVCAEIRSLQASADPHPRLASLGARAAIACTALGKQPARTARAAAARAELGARLLQLARAAGASGGTLAGLLKALKLPPDQAHQAQLQITTDLAEQASELCIESPRSSPLVLHHRAAAQS